VERPIEGPEPYRARLTSKEAGDWIGVSEDLFEKLMALHLPTVQPIRLGTKKRWAWLDVACLGYILERAGGTAPEEQE
jgi:hypothetical protein